MKKYYNIELNSLDTLWGGATMIFNSFPLFFAVYIPLVVLAVLAVIYEKQLIHLEQKLKRRIKKSIKRGLQKWKMFPFSTF